MLARKLIVVSSLDLWVLKPNYVLDVLFNGLHLVLPSTLVLTSLRSVVQICSEFVITIFGQYIIV